MNFCSQCGERVSLRVPAGDNMPRHVCDACGTVHYQNPKMVVGCIVEWEERVLLCRRAIEPRYGFWTTPAGFMERGETVEEGAAREVREEALAEVELGSLVAMVNVPHVDQVHLLYRARLVAGRFGAGDETLEAALYAQDEVPWDDLAFPSVRFGLERFFADRAAGIERLHATRVGRIVR